MEEEKKEMSEVEKVACKTLAGLHASNEFKTLVKLISETTDSELIANSLDNLFISGFNAALLIFSNDAHESDNKDESNTEKEL